MEVPSVSVQNTNATVYLDQNHLIGEISPLIFGGFAEHMGRCIYGGVYDPGSPQADERGFRKDVLAALRELDYRVMRYPGGNFLSGYHWLDGVGPRDKRPRRRDLAWQSIESNQFGADEFMAFCREINTKPMLGVNLGTGVIEEASSLVEYCNGQAGSKFSDMRVQNGHRAPYNVEYWCLGNEMDGHWQMGHLNAQEYALKAFEAAKMMKWQDPTIKLVLAGSSSPFMGTYPEWDRIALETCYEQVDFHALHHYTGNSKEDTASYLARTITFEDNIDALAATLRYVKAKLRSNRDVYLSWDEWNVWYRNKDVQGGWTEAPHLLEEVYTLEDALVVAQWLSVFLRRANILKMACIAQIANVIAPILTTREALVKQTIFYPFMLFSRFASGLSLAAAVSTPSYATAQYGDVPVLDVSATFDPERQAGAVFLVNRHESEPLHTEVVWQNQAPRRISAVYQLGGGDAKAANTFEQPDAVTPMRLEGMPVQDGRVMLSLPPLSLTVLVSE